MGIVTLDLPVVGQPNTTEDVKIRNNFTTLANVINGNIDATNLSPGILSQLGNFQSVLAAIQVQDVGNVAQVRAGRVLTSTDFTNMGLSAPIALWNLGTVNDSSGNARNLTNKGSVTFDTGILGAAAEAAVFTGSTAQALYIVDTGGADPFRIKTGSWGCWFKTAKRGTAQYIMAKYQSTGVAATSLFNLGIGTSNTIISDISNGTTISSVTSTQASTDVADNRWHFAVATYDGTSLRIYIDGSLEYILKTTIGPLNAGASAPFSIGGYGADASTATVSPFFGIVDEGFITADTLSPEQVYNLYCASIPHTLGSVPTGTRLAVRRRKRGGVLAVANFPSTPVRLHNFTAGSLTDEGSGAVGLTSNPGTGAIVSVAGADGSSGGGYSFSGAHTGLSATDAGLPSGTSSRTYGIWFKTTNTAALGGIISWGTAGTNDARIDVQVTTGVIRAVSGADAASGPVVADGLWHQAIVVEDNAVIDGVKRKLYLDGRLVATSTVLTSLTLAGANRFRIGAAADGTLPFIGQVDGAFVLAGTMTPEQIRTLYNIGSQQLSLSPKVDGVHVEALELTRILVHFDSVEGTDLVDLAVIA